MATVTVTERGADMEPKAGDLRRLQTAEMGEVQLQQFDNRGEWIDVPIVTASPT